MSVSIPVLSRFIAMLLLAAAGSVLAAPSLMLDPPEIQRRVAALAEGVYPAGACTEWSPVSSGAEPGQLRIHGGVITLANISQGLFGPGQEVGVGWRTGKESGFNWEVRAPGDRMVAISGDEKGPAESFIEIGRTPPGGGRNIAQGWQCAELDLRAMPLLSPANPLRALMAELYDTGGREVAGQCRNLGRNVNGKHVGGETRAARYGVSRDAVVLNGKTLLLRQVERLDLGSRLDDGAINGSFEWPDGSNFHVEQFTGSALSVAMFSFDEGEARWHCRPTR
jgi:hypothetical protein